MTTDIEATRADRFRQVLRKVLRNARDNHMPWATWFYAQGLHGGWNVVDDGTEFHLHAENAHGAQTQVFSANTLPTSPAEPCSSHGAPMMTSSYPSLSMSPAPLTEVPT